MVDMIIVQVVQVAVAEVELYSAKESHLLMELIMFPLDKVMMLLFQTIIHQAQVVTVELVALVHLICQTQHHSHHSQQDMLH